MPDGTLLWSEEQETIGPGSRQGFPEAEDAARPFDEAGDRIGRFVVLAPLGRGGMGTVYAAYDEQLDRKVAVKVLHGDDLPGEAERRRFQREAQALARLSHPHVVIVHEVGEADGRLYLAMEFIRGQSFAQWLRTGPDWRTVVDAFRQAGRGLAAAHEAGLVHRDFKPANLMRSDDGGVKVLDFGLARAEGEPPAEEVDADRSEPVPDSALHSSLTRPGAMMGTPAYMAPEQFLGMTADAQRSVQLLRVAVRGPLRRASLRRLLDALAGGIDGQ